MGDVHPAGNPHYTVDPGMAPAVTANILNGLARVAPQSRAAFERNRAAFLARLEQAQARWTETLAPVKGARVVVDHGIWTYFLTRFGLVQAATRGGATGDSRYAPPISPGSSSSSRTSASR